MSRSIIIIGSCRMGKKAMFEAASRAMKTENSVNVAVHYLAGCTNVRLEEAKESAKRIQDAFSFSGIAAENLKKSFCRFIETIDEFKQKESFEPQPSKFISKPKNNFRIR